jgi:dienelactone hydrolase
MPTTASVTFSSEAGQANGHVARPGKDVPGIIVLQEWWGLVPHIKDVAARFAAQGYVALAPDLYHGKSTLEAAEAQHLMEGLDWGRAAKEIAGAVRYLREVEGATRVGVTGFCMGGALTIIAATQPGVDAYAAFYGFPPAGAAPVERITAPGVIFFGGSAGVRPRWWSIPAPDTPSSTTRGRRRFGKRRPTTPGGGRSPISAATSVSASRPSASP